MFVQVTQRRRLRPRRLTAAVLVAIVSAFGFVVISPTAALAYNLYGCKWNHNNIKYNPSGASLYSSVVSGAAASWNSANAGVDPATLSSTTGTFTDMYVYAANYGNTGWTGYTSPTGHPGTDVSCTSGIYPSSTGKVSIYLNGTYIAGYSANEQKSVAAHEFGHGLGLAHNNAKANCAGGHYPAWLMYYSDDRFVGNGCGPIYGPKSDDVNGVNAIY